MLRDRSEGEDCSFSNDELRTTPGGGEATRGLLSCDDTVPTASEAFQRAKFRVWWIVDDSRNALRLARGMSGGDIRSSRRCTR